MGQVDWQGPLATSHGTLVGEHGMVVAHAISDL